MNEMPRTIEQLREYYMSSITIDDLDQGMRMLAEVIGVESALRAQLAIGGIQIYLATPSRAIERFIREHYRRFSPKEMAVALGVTEAYVYEVLRKARLAHRVGGKIYIQTDAFIDSE